MIDHQHVDLLASAFFAHHHQPHRPQFVGPGIAPLAQFDGFQPRIGMQAAHHGHSEDVARSGTRLHHAVADESVIDIEPRFGNIVVILTQREDVAGAMPPLPEQRGQGSHSASSCRWQPRIGRPV